MVVGEDILLYQKGKTVRDGELSRSSYERCWNFHSMYNIWSRAEKIEKSLGGVPSTGMGVSPLVLVLQALAVGIGKQSYAEALARLGQTLVSTSSRRGNSDICASNVSKSKVWSDRGVTGELEDTRFSAKVVTPWLIIVFFFMSKGKFIKSAKSDQVHMEYTRTTTKKKRKTAQENHDN
jgi:hypothetical protein